MQSSVLYCEKANNYLNIKEKKSDIYFRIVLRVSQRSLWTEFTNMFFSLLPQSKGVFLQLARDRTVCGCGLPYLLYTRLKITQKTLQYGRSACTWQIDAQMGSPGPNSMQQQSMPSGPPRFPDDRTECQWSSTFYTVRISPSPVRPAIDRLRSVMSLHAFKLSLLAIAAHLLGVSAQIKSNVTCDPSYSWVSVINQALRTLHRNPSFFY